MKQIVMAGPRKSRIVDVPIPEITDDPAAGESHLYRDVPFGVVSVDRRPPGRGLRPRDDRRRREVRPERDGVPGGGPGDRARRRRVQGVHRHGAGQDLPCAG